VNADERSRPGSQQVTNTRVNGDLYQIQGVAGDVNVHAQPRVRSAYLEQVARIAPDRLKYRDAELAELAAFCVEADSGEYMWACTAVGGQVGVVVMVRPAPASKSSSIVLLHHRPLPRPG